MNLLNEAVLRRGAKITGNCPVCASTASHVVGSRDKLRLVRCEQCTLVYSHPQPVEEVRKKYLEQLASRRTSSPGPRENACSTNAVCATSPRPRRRTIASSTSAAPMVSSLVVEDAVNHLLNWFGLGVGLQASFIRRP
jgi:hypothetical protein